MRETGVKNHVCLPFHDVTDNGDGVAGVRDALLFVRSLGVGAKRNGSGEPLLPSRLSLPSFPVPSPSSRRRLVARSFLLLLSWQSFRSERMRFPLQARNEF